VALLLEVGLLLILIPWSTFWDHNYFADSVPVVRDAIRNNYVRGAVSGLGLLNVYAALAELADVFLRRGGDEPPPGIVDRHGH
jgi:hypothetical protein